MRRWYKKRGGYVKLPRIPWGQRPSWYVKPRPRTTPIFRPPSYTKYVNTEAYNELLDKIEENKYKEFTKNSIKRKHGVKRVVTVPLTPDQKKLLEVTTPKSLRKKKVQSSKDASSWNKKKFTQLESQSQETNQTGEDMPRLRQRYRIRTPKGVFRGKRPRTVLRRNLRPRRRKMSSMVRVKPMGSGTTFSYYKERSKYRSFRKRVAVLSPRQMQVTTVGSRIEWTYSKQGRANFNLMHKQDINTIVNNIPGYNDATRFFLKDATDEYYMSNQSNANAYIRIYHFWVRRDVDTTISALMDRAMSDINISGGTLATTDNYGITPFMASPVIAPFFKFVKSYLIELGAGRSHRHYCKYSWNKEWNQEIYAEGLGSTAQDVQSKLAGWSRCVFMLMHGEPVNDVTTKNTVVPSGGAIDIVRKTITNYYYGEPTKPLMEFLTSLPTTGVTENVMEAETDQASTVERA